jgi:hypothetical protein
MAGKPILGKLLIEFIHHPITGNLGQNTGSCNAETDAIPPDESGVLDWQSLHRKPIHESMGALMSIFMKSSQSACHGEMSCSQNIKLPDFF